MTVVNVVNVERRDDCATQLERLQRMRKKQAVAAPIIKLTELGPLLKEIRGGRFRGFFFQGQMHVLAAVAESGGVVLRFRGSYEINHLPVVSSIDAEVGAVDSEYLGAWVPLAHYDNRCVGQIHLLVACHKGAEPRPVCRNREVHPNRVALEQLKQRIDVQPIGTQKVCHLGEDRLRRQHRGTHLLHQRDGPRVIRVVAVQIATSGPVSQIVITTARTFGGRWSQPFDRRPHCPQHQR